MYFWALQITHPAPAAYVANEQSLWSFNQKIKKVMKKDGFIMVLQALYVSVNKPFNNMIHTVWINYGDTKKTSYNMANLAESLKHLK